MSEIRTNSIVDAAGTGSPAFPNGLRVNNIVDATGGANAMINGDVPVTGRGQIAFFAISTPPTGWLKANGALVSRTTYAGLFAVIGTTYGSGDGSTTFALPDLRGEFLRAWDDGRGVDSARAFASAQSSQNLAHTHTQIYYQQTASIGQSASGANNAGAATANYLSTNTGSSGGTEARPRNIALLACIKF